MIRFTWMQARAQIMVVIGALTVLAVVLVITGPHLVHLNDASPVIRLSCSVTWPVLQSGTLPASGLAAGQLAAVLAVKPPSVCTVVGLRPAAS